MCAPKITHKEFVKRANSIHNNKFKYPDQYQGSRIKLTIVCPIHGNFKQAPYSHLTGNGCRACDVERRSKNNTLTHEQFLKKSIAAHGNLYEYIDTYKHSQQKLTINCKIHGNFEQLANTHMLGGGCPTCADARRTCGYTNEYFVVNPLKRTLPGILYILKFEENSNSFIKIGITKNFKQRYCSYKRVGFPYKVLQIKETTLYKAFTLEQKTISTLNKYRYYPKVKFEGWTECFNYSSTVMQQIKKLIHD